MRSGPRSWRVAALVDTNVLLYAYDASEAEKQQRAAAVLESLERRRSGALSTQVLGEFFTNAMHKIPAPLSLAQAERSVTSYTRRWPVYSLTSAVVLEAVRSVREHQLSYWDGLIWATAKLNGVPTVLSENFGNRNLLEGVRLLDPLVLGFDPTALG